MNSGTTFTIENKHEIPDGKYIGTWYSGNISVKVKKVWRDEFGRINTKFVPVASIFEDELESIFSQPLNRAWGMYDVTIEVSGSELFITG